MIPTTATIAIDVALEAQSYVIMELKAISSVSLLFLLVENKELLLATPIGLTSLVASPRYQ